MPQNHIYKTEIMFISTTQYQSEINYMGRSFVCLFIRVLFNILITQTKIQFMVGLLEY